MNEMSEVLFNTTSILIIVAVALFCYNKIVELLRMNEEEQKEIAIKIIKEELLKMMTDSELNWSEFEKSGELKRAEVIKEIYDSFPILKKIKDQDALILEINKMIDDTKVIMDEIVKRHKEENVITENTKS